MSESPDARTDAEAAKAFLKLAVANHLITSDQARKAHLEAEKARADPSEILLARGLLTAKAIANLRAEVDSRLGPKRIGGHRILSTLGRGGMGVVYRAEQKGLQREVALKVMDETISRAEPGTAQRFLREATTMARIKDDHVVTVFDAGRDGDAAYIVMELVDGGDAERLRVQLGGRMAPKRALEIIRDAAVGLQAIHDSQLVHRDIKPANIFLTQRGKAKLADLGLTRDVVKSPGTTTLGGHIRGTPAFMSPEQARDDDIDIRTDIYALGATLYTLLTGRAPYVAANSVAVAMLAIRGPFPDPLEIVPVLPAPVVSLIKRATAHLRSERYQTPAEFVAAITAVLADPQITRAAPSGEVQSATPVAGASPTPPVPAPTIAANFNSAAGLPASRPWQPSWTVILALAAIVIVLLVAGGWWYLASDDAPLPAPPVTTPTPTATTHPVATTATAAAIAAIEQPTAPDQPRIWFDDVLPDGVSTYVNHDSWTWIAADPAPFSGKLAHRSDDFPNLHHHAFEGAIPEPVGAGDILFTWVRLDPAHRPTEIYLAFKTGEDDWKHGAYWGANNLGLGTDGTNSRRYLGDLPEAGAWTRLDIPARAIGLDGRTVNGMDFALCDGSAAWDCSGIRPGHSSPTTTTTPNPAPAQIEEAPTPATAPTVPATATTPAPGGVKAVLVGTGWAPDGNVPPWAADHNGDGYGYWATLKIRDTMLKFRHIPAGTFTMGSPADEAGRGGDETAHAVTISKAFWLSDTQIPQRVWQAVMGGNPSADTVDANLPVETITWLDCDNFCAALAKLKPGTQARLPTEAEYEYACRAGTTTPYPGDLTAMAWMAVTTDGKRHPVGQLKANPWGLHDVNGNVFQWCSDWYGDYPTAPATDPTGPATGTQRVVRGASSGDPPPTCRSAHRHHLPPAASGGYIGLRIILP